MPSKDPVVSQAWHQRHPGYQRAWQLRTWYHMTLAEFDAKLARQGGRCAICGTNDPGGPGNTFHVDHDHRCCPGSHSCGKCVRGLLCFRCNNALGLFHDDRKILDSAIYYLQGWG